MSCKFICDGCGKEAPGVFYKEGDRNWHKPETWYERSDSEDGAQTACSRECVEDVAKKSGKTCIFLPI